MFTPPLVENIAKKNHSCFPIAVLLTTLICSRQITTNFICKLLPLFQNKTVVSILVWD
jgi:hypothetical protein